MSAEDELELEPRRVLRGFKVRDRRWTEASDRSGRVYDDVSLALTFISGAKDSLQAQEAQKTSMHYVVAHSHTYRVTFNGEVVSSIRTPFD